MLLLPPSPPFCSSLVPGPRNSSTFALSAPRLRRPFAVVLNLFRRRRIRRSEHISTGKSRVRFSFSAYRLRYSPFFQEMDESPKGAKNEPASLPSSQTQPESHGSDVKARVDAVWQQLNKGVSTKTLYSIVNSSSTAGTKTVQKEQASHNWMTVLGLGSKKTEPNETPLVRNSTAPTQNQNETSEEAKKIAAAALAAAKDAAAAASALHARGKIEVKEIRDFAGEEIEVKKLVDPNSEAAEKAKVSAGASSAVDAVLEQIKKKPKLSVLDKTKKDWGEFKEEHKGLEDELDAYKKSSNQYLDRVSFLQRADYREFERERDARLAMHSKRRPDVREDP